MASIKIEIQEHGKPAATITIPLWLLRRATGMLSSLGKTALGSAIDVEELARAARGSGANGTILDVLDHQANDRIIISLQPDSDTADHT